MVIKASQRCRVINKKEYNMVEASEVGIENHCTFSRLPYLLDIS
jgi:hypothetical protein